MIDLTDLPDSDVDDLDDVVAAQKITRSSPVTVVVGAAIQTRSPSRRGSSAFDDSTIELSVADSESESDSSAHHFGRPHPPVVGLMAGEEADRRYQCLVGHVGRNLLRQLCTYSRASQNIADDLSRVSHVTMVSDMVANKISNERTQLYLTEAIMKFSEALCELTALQSHLLQASSLKDQGMDPRCPQFNAQDKHFEVHYPLYDHSGGSSRRII